MQETQEDLEAVFGEEMRAAGLLRSDDRRLDSSIEKSERKGKSEDKVREWEDGAEFASNRDVVEGEVGERDGAGVVQQGGEVPDVEEHAPAAGGKVDAAARKAAKKQRRLAELKQKEEAKAK